MPIGRNGLAAVLALMAFCQLVSSGYAPKSQPEPEAERAMLCGMHLKKDGAKIGGSKAELLGDYVSLFMGYTNDYVDRKGGRYDEVLNGAVGEVLDIMGIELSSWEEKYPEYNLRFPEGSSEAENQLKLFLETIARCASQNEYLLDFFVELRSNHAEEVANDYKMLHQEHLKDEHGVLTSVALDQKITEACVYAHVLNVLTHAGRKKPLEVLPYFMEIFRAKTRDLKKDDFMEDSFLRHFLNEENVFESLLENNMIPVTEHMNLFEFVKKLGLDIAVDGIIEYVEKGSLDGNNFGLGVPVNIMEACLEDYRLGNFANGDASLPMLRTAPEQAIECEWVRTKKGTVTDNALWMYPMFPKLWADLYSTWNAAFVSHYSNTPFFYGKLFNPQVLCYEDTPQEYLHNRMIALWLHIYFEFFNRVKMGSDAPKNNWSSPTVTDVWEEVNLKSSQRYDRAVKTCLPLCPEQPPKNLKLDALISLTSDVNMAFKKRWEEYSDSLESLLDHMTPTKELQRERKASLERGVSPIIGGPIGEGDDDSDSGSISPVIARRLEEKIRGMSSSEYFAEEAKKKERETKNLSTSDAESSTDSEGPEEFYDAQPGPVDIRLPGGRDAPSGLRGQ